MTQGGVLVSSFNQSVFLRRLFHRNRFAIRGTVHVKIVLLSAVILLIFSLLHAPVQSFLNEISSSIALSDATDIVTVSVNDAIISTMGEGRYGYDYFVSIEKDSEGNITALSANMSRINSVSSEILRRVIETTSDSELKIGIPIGNLFGSTLTLGRGPEIPMKINVLTSSFADFRNELVSVGINQSKHQIILELMVEIDVLLPWKIETTRVLCEVLIAETIIVGKVPDTYMNLTI